MTEAPFKPPTKGMNKTAIIAVVIVAIVIVAAVVIVVEERKAVTPTAPSNKVEFYTWWATTGKVALDKLIPQFESANPGYTVSPYIAPGAGGTNAIYAILSLMEAGKPPATFQNLLGTELLSYIESAPNGASSFVNQTSYLNSLKNVTPQILYASEFNGKAYEIPVDAHLGSVLYINLQLLKEYNLTVPRNLTTLISDTMALKSHGLSPWMIPGADGGYDQSELWSGIFLALGGPTMTDELNYGLLNLSNTNVKNVLYNTDKIYLELINSSYSGEQSMTWTEGISDLASKDVAFQSDVDSATNYLFDYLNLTTYPATSPYLNETNVTVIAEPFPGTQNYWQVVSDSVAVPSGPTSTTGELFAKYFGSFQGQKVFTKWKAATYYDNVTSDYYNTPYQWYAYEDLINVSSDNFVIQPGLGGLFSSTTSSFDTGLISLQEAGVSDLSAWNSTLESIVSNEKSDWMAANSIGLGYLGGPGHPFGGYLPEWANTSANRTVSTTLTTWKNTDSQNNMVNDHVISVDISPFSFTFFDKITTGVAMKS